MDRLIVIFTEEWDTNKGLGAYFFLSISLSLVVLGLIPSYIVHLAIFYVVILVIFYSVWKSRRTPHFLLKRVNIVFFLYNATKTEDVESQINNFKSFFSEKVSNYKYRGIKVYYQPSDRRITSIEEAQKIIQHGYPGHTLIVWGEFGQFKGRIECRNTNFTYEFSYKRYYPDESVEDIKKRFGIDIQKRIDSLSWNLNLLRSKQFETYTDNIRDASIYILSRTLLTVGEADKSLQLINSLLGEMNQTLNPYEQQKMGALISALQELGAWAAIYKGYSYFLKKLWQESESYYKISMQYKKTYDALIVLAYISEIINNKETEALSFLLEAEKIAPPRANMHMIGKAYLDFKNYNFNEALNNYKEIARSHRLDTNPSKLVEDLHNMYCKTDNAAFLFAEGFVQFYFLSRSDGISLLSRFIKETRDARYDVLIQEAKKILDKVNKIKV